MIKQILAIVGLTFSLSVNAAVVEVGDLNIISDVGNASDGLRFLDMTYSVGLSQSAALINAQATYANARLATPIEFDNLFAAAGIGYDGPLTASDGFASGSTVRISSDISAGALIQQLGETTFDSRTIIFTDPDQSTAFNSTRDLISIAVGDVQIVQTRSIGVSGGIGYLIVSPVPVPAAAWLFISAIGGLVLAKRKQLKA